MSVWNRPDVMAGYPRPQCRKGQSENKLSAVGDPQIKVGRKRVSGQVDWTGRKGTVDFHSTH